MCVYGGGGVVLVVGRVVRGFGVVVCVVSVCVGGGWGGGSGGRCSRVHVCGGVSVRLHYSNFFKHTLVGSTLHFTKSNKFSLYSNLQILLNVSYKTFIIEFY